MQINRAKSYWKARKEANNNNMERTLLVVCFTGHSESEIEINRSKWCTGSRGDCTE